MFSGSQARGAQSTRMFIAFTLVVLPWMAGLLSLVVSPKYLGPFLTHPIGIVATIISAVLTALAFLALCSTPSKVVWALVILFMVMPLFLVPMLGPAVVTIFSALGPVFDESASQSRGAGSSETEQSTTTPDQPTEKPAPAKEAPPADQKTPTTEEAPPTPR